MKVIITAVVVVAVALIWLFVSSRSQISAATQTELSKAKPGDPKDVYAGLRNTMLQGSRAKFGLAPASSLTEPWGVVMDWGVEKGTVTVVAISDGTASVYFSTGGGFIGGGGQEPIQRAAKKAIEAAHSVQPSMRTAATYPLPPRGGVIFYLATDAGVFTANTTESELNSVNHPFRKLGDAMQEVITQYRLWDEQRKSSK